MGQRHLRLRAPLHSTASVLHPTTFRLLCVALFAVATVHARPLSSTSLPVSTGRYLVARQDVSASQGSTPVSSSQPASATEESITATVETVSTDVKVILGVLITLFLIAAAGCVWAWWILWGRRAFPGTSCEACASTGFPRRNLGDKILGEDASTRGLLIRTPQLPGRSRTRDRVVSERVTADDYIARSAAKVLAWRTQTKLG